MSVGQKVVVRVLVNSELQATSFGFERTAFRGIPGGQRVHQAWLSDWDWESLTGRDVKSFLKLVLALSMRM